MGCTAMFTSALKAQFTDYIIFDGEWFSMFKWENTIEMLWLFFLCLKKIHRLH